MPDALLAPWHWLLSPAFTLWGADTSWLELVAVVLALAMVGFNIRERHWGWPLAIVSSLLYFGLFSRSRLYGDAALQIFFALVAFWGWVKWLRGRRPDGTVLRVTRLSARGAWAVVAACAVLWPAVALFLQRFTDTDVPWWDAFPTAVSLVGQYLLGRKYIENWLAWLAVNTVSVGLFAYKGLWLTTGLYALFIVLSFVGWQAWKRRLAPAAP
ncbi:nicotinamide riboside transporter PnuC [Pseudorhodoferax sp. Leaf267]|uniref:nicotinamide riboside transporter PnuC n=1 Tax=Pseudorhodoferax sp. Leaf267 TaxID=1736316 RepID=UPI0006FFDBD9|nr:nicotinamide riboside transporter PnuC [Pseudorhodoferax sp. Leaf267]KQP22598.1 transporter [Pseudorhodoferax sp. Leaf267]